MDQSITMDKFKQIITKYPSKVIDVREVSEFENGHIYGAINLPLSGLEKNIPMLASQKYFVICQSGGRSQVASQLLSSVGYEVVNVLGGMSAWTGPLSMEE